MGGKVARRKKQKIKLPEEEIEKSPGLFQKLLLWVVIPLLFASALLLIIAKFADINVFDKAKEITSEIPFIGEPKEADLDEKGADDSVLEDRVVSLQAEIKEKEAEVFQLQQKLETADDEKEDLLIEQERLLDEIAVLERGEDGKKQKFSEIVSTFEKMSAKAAAPVLVNMSDAEAIQVLSNLKTDKLAAILEKMSPEDAAKYTTMMTK